MERKQKEQMKTNIERTETAAVGRSELLAGLSVMTVINLKHSGDEYMIYTSSGPHEGKYSGWILTKEGRPIINSQPTHANREAAIAHMKSVVAACRSWESPANVEVSHRRADATK